MTDYVTTCITQNKLFTIIHRATEHVDEFDANISLPVSLCLFLTHFEIIMRTRKKKQNQQHTFIHTQCIKYAYASSQHMHIKVLQSLIKLNVDEAMRTQFVASTILIIMFNFDKRVGMCVRAMCVWTRGVCAHLNLLNFMDQLLGI